MLYEFIGRQNKMQMGFLNTIWNSVLFKYSGRINLTKSKIEGKATQGIANNDVINRTKLRKLGDFLAKTGSLYHQISLGIGFVCDIMNTKRKIKIQPLNMVFK